MFLRDYWYAAAWDHEIGREVLARVILKEPVVLYRRLDGTPVALEDRCAHRRLQLSMGHLVGDDLQCRYHGLRYDCTGKCIKIPGQKTIPKNLRVRSYPIVERHKFIWIWMGAAERADESKIPDFHLLDDPAWCPTGDRYHVPANYQLIIDNLCDLSHVAYLHSAYTGNEPVGELARIKTKRSFEPGDEWVRGQRWTYDVEPAQTYKTFGHYDGNIDRWQIYEFRPPGFFRINNGSAIAGTGASEKTPEGGDGRWGFRVYHAITPETEKSTHYFWVVMHDIGAYTPAVCVPFHREHVKILSQDVEVFCSQQLIIDLDPDAPTREINADQGLTQARAIISQLLQQQQRLAAAE